MLQRQGQYSLPVLLLQPARKRVFYLRTDEDIRKTHEWVDATLKGNIYAGVGAACLVVAGAGGWCLYRRIQFTDVHLIAAVLTGLGWFALLSFVRYSIDEWLKAREILDQNAMLDLLALKDAENADLRAENKRLNSMLRGQEFREASKNAKHVVAADEPDVLRNVERILATWKAGNPYGRDYCRAMGMTRPEWESAILLMQKAGVVGKGGPGNQQWVVVAPNYSEGLMRVRERAGLRTRTESTNFVAA